MFATLKTLVLKTATVTGVKPAAPADRIGLGFGVDAYPADNLSPNPASEQVGPRELSAMRPQEMRLRVGDAAVPPASLAGCPSAPGVSVGRSATRSGSLTNWRLATRTAATGRTGSVRLLAVPSRDHVPGDFRHPDRPGRDCHSLRRLGDKQVATREVVSAATAGK